MLTERIKRRVHALLDPRADKHLADRTFNVLVTALILANVAAVVMETVADFAAQFGLALIYFEVFSISLFSIEYVLRLWTAPLDPENGKGPWVRLRYAATPMAILDLLAVLPFYLAFLDLNGDFRLLLMFRVFRIFVLFKLMRYSYAIKTLINVLQRQRGELGVTLVIGLVLLIFASGFMFHLEHLAQPKAFSSIPAAMWWGVVTLTTVGYGDMYPITPLGKLFGGAIACLGLGLFALPAGIIASGFAEEIRQRRMEVPCPHCGKTPQEAHAVTGLVEAAPSLTDRLTPN